MSSTSTNKKNAASGGNGQPHAANAAANEQPPPNKTAKLDDVAPATATTNSMIDPAFGKAISKLSLADMQKVLESLAQDGVAAAKKVLQDLPKQPRTEMEEAWQAFEQHKKAFEQWKPYEKIDPTKHLPKDVWIGSKKKSKGQSGILSFVPPGNFRSVAGVNLELKALVLEADPWLIHHRTDIWMQILSFLGPGHFLYLALVSKKFKELYKKSFGTPATHCIHGLPKVQEGRYLSRPATYKDTFYRAAFSSVARAKFWNQVATDVQHLEEESSVCYKVAKYGNVAVLEWAQKQEGFEWKDDQHMIAEAARGGNLETVKYLHSNGYPWGTLACYRAAEGGHLEVLQYLHENMCPWDADACAVAALKGHLDVLKYLHEKECPWDSLTCCWAAGEGHLEVLKFAHEEGCLWDEDTCSNAAFDGHLEVLKYAHDNGCEWDEETCSGAAENGHFECLKYARAQGCPWADDTHSLAMEGGYYEIAAWAKENGCPIDSDDSE